MKNVFTKKNLPYILLFLGAGLLVAWIVGNYKPYTQTVWYNGESYPNQTVIKGFPFGTPKTQLPDGTMIKWENNDWILQ